MTTGDLSVFLRPLTLEDATLSYASWLQDEETNQYLESRWQVYSLEDLQNYIKSMNASPTNYLFGICLHESHAHIGNIKIGGIDQIHRFANLGLLLGNKNQWGKGYATQAIRLATDYAFNELNLNKVIAGIYAGNIGSYKAFLKAGYNEVGRWKKHRFYKGTYVDEILMEKIRER